MTTPVDVGEIERLRARVAELEAELGSRPAVTTGDEPAGSAPGRARTRVGWWRTALCATLITLGAVLAPLSVVAAWAHDQVGDTDRYVETVTPLASDPAVQNAIIDRVTTEIFSRLDVEELTTEAVDALEAQGLPDRVATGLDALASPLANGVRDFVTERVTRIVKSPEFADAWVTANREAHAQLVAVLTGEDTDTVEVTGTTVAINLAVVIDTVKAQLVDAGFGLASRIPEVNAQFTIIESADLAKAQNGFSLLSAAARWLPFLGVLALAAAVYVAKSRRKAVFAAGLAVAGSMLLLGVTLNAFRPVYLGAVPEDVLPDDAAGAIYDRLVWFIRLNLRALLVLFLAIAAGAWLSGPSQSAVATRRVLSGAIGSMRGGAEHVGFNTGPVGAWVYRYRTLLRALVIGIALLVYVAAAHPTGSWTLKLLGLAVLALVVVEFLARPPRADVPTLPPQGAAPA